MLNPAILGRTSRGDAAIGSRHMPRLTPEHGSSPCGFPGMETPQDYQKFAEEFPRLAKQVSDRAHRAILEEMAEVWLRLAAEAAKRTSRDTERA